MVGLVILFPHMVMVYKDDAPKVDPSTMQIEVPFEEPAPDRGGTDFEAKPGDGKDGAAPAKDETTTRSPTRRADSPRPVPPRSRPGDAPAGGAPPSRDRRRRCGKEKAPRRRGAFFAPGPRGGPGLRGCCDYFLAAGAGPRMACAMKLSKRFSATPNHWICSSRNFFHST